MFSLWYECGTEILYALNVFCETVRNFLTVITDCFENLHQFITVNVLEADAKQFGILVDVKVL